ncbi:MAG: response regulator transcription factor [Eubacterium sp.]|nr:response regulator transcription factor [Eubacterium sp.]
MKLLIIEDDKEIARLLSVYLEKNGYQTVMRHDGVSGLNELKGHTADYGMVLLDMMLPGFSGEELLPKFRAVTDIPVIVISAVSALDSRLSMMRTGADDYIIKPFELPDVLVRIEAVARRYQIQLEGDDAEKIRIGSAQTGTGKKAKLSYGNITVDQENTAVTVKGQEITLTAREYDILVLLLSYPTKLFSKANLYESVWNEEYFPEDQSLKVHMSNLRSKLRKYDDFDYIETVWGMGYRLRKMGNL